MDRVQAELERNTVARSRRPKRTFKAFFCGPRKDHAPTALLNAIPSDIIWEIVDLLAPSEILNLSLTSSHLRALLLPALYDNIVLKSSRKCRRTLEMFARRPDLAQYIKKLAVRPNYYLAWPKPDEHLEDAWVVEKLERMAPNLTALHTFDWDGLELPKDRLWRTLRNNCPKLRSVFTNVGTQALDPSSELFNFHGLTSFSLIVRHGLGGTEVFPPLEKLPPQFWDMIVHRCPDLEELAICSFSSSNRIFDFSGVAKARWPKLHTLTLGSFGYLPPLFTLGPTEAISLGNFLSAHKALKYVRFLWNFKHWMSPDSIPMHLNSGALPVLNTFIGVYQQLADLPNPESIETLDLTCEPIYEIRIGAVCPILRRMTNLTSLDLWAYVFDSVTDHASFFRPILEAVPGLTDFHFLCTTAFNNRSLKQLLSQLSLLRSLKRFQLTKGHRYMDESMLDTALQVLKYNPGVTQIILRWAHERFPNHLKQEGIYEVVAGAGSPQGKRIRRLASLGPRVDMFAAYKAKTKSKLKGAAAVAAAATVVVDGGVADVGCDARGVRNEDPRALWMSADTRPHALLVVERGIPIIGTPFEKRYRYELQPKNVSWIGGRMKVGRMWTA